MVERLVSFLLLALLAGFAGAQPAGEGDPLPARSFLRIGTSKLRHGSPILCLAYSPDGQTLAAGGGNDPLRLWNARTGALVREFNEPWVQAVAFTLSGETMVYASLQKTIRVWNFKLNKETARLEGHKAAIKAIAIPSDTSLIASGSQDGAIYLWDWNTKKKLAELNGHTDEVTALVYTPDNNLLISGGSDHIIQIWSGETNKSTRKLDAGCGVQALAVSADGQTLYSAGDDYLIRRWDIASGKQTGAFKGHEGIVVSLAVRGDTLVSGALDRTVRFWDAKTTNLLRSLSRLPGDSTALAVSKAGDFFATAGTNNVIRIFAADGKEVIPAAGPQAGLTTLIVSPDRTRLASVSLAGEIFVWDAPTGKLVQRWDSKQSGDIALAYAPDGKALLSASDSVRFWNADTGAALAQLPTRAGEQFVTIAFSPDGKTLAVGQRNSQIDLWDLDQKKPLQSLKYAGSLHALAWSPNGKYVAAAGFGKIMIWDSQTANLFRSFEVKEGPPAPFPQIYSLVFGPDSRTLAAGCFDATIRVYNLFTKNPTAVEEQILCEGHLSMPYGVAYSPDGRTLASGSFDRTIRLWEAFSGKQIAQYKGHAGAVMGVAFAADGRSFYSAGSDATIFQWDVPGLSGHGKLPELTLAPGELELSWTLLASEETPKGQEAMWRCIASGKHAIPNLTKRLYLLEPERVKKLFKDLDSNHYPTRLGAMRELTDYGRWMEGRYIAAMANPPSLEYKRRIETLREKLTAANSPSLAQERLRARRIMLMCEQVGSPEAIEALRKLAEKGPEEELQEEAKGSLQRLSKKKQI